MKKAASLKKKILYMLPIISIEINGKAKPLDIYEDNKETLYEAIIKSRSIKNGVCCDFRNSGSQNKGIYFSINANTKTITYADQPTEIDDNKWKNIEKILGTSIWDYIVGGIAETFVAEIYRHQEFQVERTGNENKSVHETNDSEINSNSADLQVSREDIETTNIEVKFRRNMEERILLYGIKDAYLVVVNPAEDDIKVYSTRLQEKHYNDWGGRVETSDLEEGWPLLGDDFINEEFYKNITQKLAAMFRNVQKTE